MNPSHGRAHVTYLITNDPVPTASQLHPVFTKSSYFESRGFYPVDPETFQVIQTDCVHVFEHPKINLLDRPHTIFVIQ